MAIRVIALNKHFSTKKLIRWRSPVLSLDVLGTVTSQFYTKVYSASMHLSIHLVSMNRKCKLATCKLAMERNTYSSKCKCREGRLRHNDRKAMLLTFMSIAISVVGMIRPTALFFVLVLIIGGGETVSNCSQGPYLIVEVDRHVGIGAMMNSYKPSLLIAAYFNLRLIPTKNYFHWEEHQDHQTNFMTTLGFDRGITCKEEDLDSLVATRRINLIRYDLSKVGTTLTEQDKAVLWAEDCPNSQRKIDPDGLLAFIGRELAALGDSSSRTVMIIETKAYLDPFHEENYVCTREIFAHMFWRRYMRDMKASKSMVRNRSSFRSIIIVAWHFRYGDDATGSIHRTPRNALPFDDGVKALTKILYNNGSVMRTIPAKEVRVNFIAWGPEEHFEEVKQLFDGRVNVIASTAAKDDYDHFDMLATSDILIGGMSSFTRLAAAVNTQGVLIIDPFAARSERGHNEFYAGFNNTLPINFDIQDFNRLLCQQLQRYKSPRILKHLGC